MQRNLDLEAFDDRVVEDLDLLSWKKEYNENVAAKIKRKQEKWDAEEKRRQQEDEEDAAN